MATFLNKKTSTKEHSNNNEDFIKPLFRSRSKPENGTEDSTASKSILEMADNKILKDIKNSIESLFKSNTKADDTGDITEPLHQFESTATKAKNLEEQSRNFCAMIRNFVYQGSTLTFLSECEDEASDLHRSLSSPYMQAIDRALKVHIESPIGILRGNLSIIEASLTSRRDLLAVYQRCKRKYDAMKQKAPTTVPARGGSRDVAGPDEIDVRLAKLDSASLKLEKATLYTLAHFAALEFTYPRLRKQIASAMAAISGASCRTILHALKECDIVTRPKTISIFEETTRVVLELREGCPLPPLAIANELEDYVYALQEAQEAQKGVFGRNLEEFGGVCPELVVRSISFLDRHGLYVKGIFRVPGNEGHIIHLKGQFNEGVDVHFEESRYHDVSDIPSVVFDVASLLKLFLRELPEPLIPRFAYPAFVKLAFLSTEDLVQTVRAFLESDNFPAINAMCLRFLLGLLLRVTRLANYNMMTAENLAIVFAPTLLRPPGEDDINLADLQPSIVFLKRLIEESESVWAEDFWTDYPSGYS